MGWRDPELLVVEARELAEVVELPVEVPVEDAMLVERELELEDVLE